jgi:hypothetical protein
MICWSRSGPQPPIKLVQASCSCSTLAPKAYAKDSGVDLIPVIGIGKIRVCGSPIAGRKALFMLPW